MAKIELKYVQSFKDRHGVMRHYYRRNGRRRPLPGDPGSREFMEAYANAAAEFAAPKKPPKREIPAARTFAALAVAYFGSANFRDLSSTSRMNYRRIIDGFVRAHGHGRVDQFRREHIVKIIGAMSSTPGAAIILLKRVRTLVHFAIELGWIENDPTSRVRSFKSVEIHTWDESEIAAFETRWARGTRQRLAFDILLYTGQRGSDVHSMLRPDARNKIHVTQQKTGAKLAIALHPELADSIKAFDHDSRAPNADPNLILTTAYGQPFSVKGFGQFMSAAISAASLPARCKAHGLRKASARRLAEAGASANEIMSLTGHKTLAEVERYVRAAGQELLNESALRKQIESAARSDVVSNLDLERVNPVEIAGILALPTGVAGLRESAISRVPLCRF